MHGTLKPIKRKPRPKKGKKRKVGFALGGGGVHTAFTAGFLSQLFESKSFTDNFTPTAFSGTSGGAQCAALTVYALNNPETENVTDILNDYWTAIGAMNPSIADYNAAIRINPVFAFNPFIPQYPNLPKEFTEHAQSQYGHKVPDILKETIKNHAPDWDTIKNGNIELFINAVGYDPKTDEAYHKVFDKNTLSPDAAAASGALKWMGGHVVDDELLFDGAYWANPCTNDVLNTGIDDLFIVTVQTKSEEETTPAHQRELRNSHEEPGHELMLKGIHRHAAHIAEQHPEIKIHIISLDAPAHWDQTSKGNTDPQFIKELDNRGREAAKKSLKAQKIPTKKAKTTRTKKTAPKLEVA